MQDATERALTGPIPNSELESVTGTPTVLVNGKQYVGSLEDTAEFQAFVLQAAGESYSESNGTPTPTPTPSVRAFDGPARRPGRRRAPPRTRSVGCGGTPCRLGAIGSAPLL